MLPADILEAVADDLFVNGRARFQGQDDEGRRCPLGAIAHVQGRNAHSWPQELDSPAGLALALYLSRHLSLFAPVHQYRDLSLLVHTFNDYTDDDDLVIDTLKLAAKEFRNADRLHG